MTEAPVALVGVTPDTARALRELGLLAVVTPHEPLGEVIGALRTLRYAGVLLGPRLEEPALAHVSPDAAARRAGRTDAVSLAGEAHGTHTLEDALTRTVEASGYAVRGARVLIVGRGVALRAALGLSRLGLSSLTVAADSRPEAEAALALVPAGVKAYGVASGDPALDSLAERADLVVVAGAAPPTRALQPFHTLVDLDGTAGALAARLGVTVLDTRDLPAVRLALALEHATGQRFRPEVLRDAAQTLNAS